jgi:hypothetical protein
LTIVRRKLPNNAEALVIEAMIGSTKTAGMPRWPIFRGRASWIHATVMSLPSPADLF